MLKFVDKQGVCTTARTCACTLNLSTTVAELQGETETGTTACAVVPSAWMVEEGYWTTAQHHNANQREAVTCHLGSTQRRTNARPRHATCKASSSGDGQPRTAGKEGCRQWGCSTCQGGWSGRATSTAQPIAPCRPVLLWSAQFHNGGRFGATRLASRFQYLVNSWGAGNGTSRQRAPLKYNTPWAVCLSVHLCQQMPPPPYRWEQEGASGSICISSRSATGRQAEARGHKGPPQGPWQITCCPRELQKPQGGALLRCGRYGEHAPSTKVYQPPGNRVHGVLQVQQLRQQPATKRQLSRRAASKRQLSRQAPYKLCALKEKHRLAQCKHTHVHAERHARNGGQSGRQQNMDHCSSQKVYAQGTCNPVTHVLL